MGVNLKTSTVAIIAGAIGLYALTAKKQAPLSEAARTDDFVSPNTAQAILNASDATAALAIGNAALNAPLSPFAPNSPEFTSPQAYTPNPNAPNVTSTTVNPKDFVSYEQFFAAWFPTAFTQEWQDKYAGNVGSTPQERDRNAQVAADYRRSLYNTASDIFMTSRQ